MGQSAFIVFEGIDGSGKSTQARRLAESLRTKEYDVVLTREPTDSPAGKELRRIARDGRRGVSLERETSLFQEDRSLHTREVIEPALRAGKIVISDRYWPSTVAYQGALGGDGNAIAAQSRSRFPKPDLIVYLAIAPAKALARIRAGRPDGPAPGYEKESFLEKVLTRYEAQVAPHWLRLEGSQPEDDLAGRIMRAVMELLGRQGDSGALR